MPATDNAYVKVTQTQYHVALVIHFWLGIVVGCMFGYAFAAGVL